MASRGSQESKTSQFGDSDFVVVANRLPVDLERLPDGTTSWKRSPGGLVTALEPLLRRRRGAWVGWAGIADEGDGPDDEPIIQEDLELRPVRLSAEDAGGKPITDLRREDFEIFDDGKKQPITVFSADRGDPPGTPANATKFFAEETALWGRVIREKHITVQ